MHEGRTIGIRTRLLKYILLFSLFLMILFACVQSAIDYRIRLRAIEAAIKNVLQIQHSGMSRALWNYDNEQLNAYISGVVQLPYFTYAEVLSGGESIARIGTPAEGRCMEHRTSLTYADREIGEFLLHADTALVLRSTLRNVLLTFPFQAIAVMVVSLFLLGLFDRMVLCHLVVAARHVQTFDVENPGKPLELAKRDAHDEIDLLIQAFNRMQKNLSVAYKCQTESIRLLCESKEDLRQNRQMLARILDLVPMSIFWKDERGVYQGCNRVYAAEIGMEEPEQIVGKTDHDLRPIWSRVCSHEEMRQDEKEDVPRIGVIEKQCGPDGSVRWLSVSRIPLLDESGGLDERATVRGVLGVHEDITERKRADELAMEKEAAERASHVKSAFLANMSHEIRTPLNAILGFSRLMQRDTEIPVDQKKRLDTIVRSGEHLLALINNILDFSKIEAGRVQVSEHTFDLHRMLEEVEIMFRLPAEEKKIFLRVEPGSDIPQCVTADEAKMRQVLINLVGNAVKFTGQGGVTIRVKVEPASGGRSMLTVDISDTGPGIAPGEMSDLFESFHQTASGLRVGGGTGLGLAISQQMASLMGGGIRAESQLGKGSRFILTLPITVEEGTDCLCAPSSFPGGVIQLAPGSVVPRVLIVDDVEANRELARDLLTAAGFEVSVAEDGKEAIERFRSWMPDLILMDLIMPVMDGYEAIRRIRSLPHGDRVKILAVSASVFIDTRNEVVGLGADDFLGKPMQEDLLFDKIRRLCGVTYLCRDPQSIVMDDGRDVLEPEMDIQFPSREELVELFELAQSGDLSGIVDHAEVIRRNNPATACFVERITAWAQAYEEKRIREYLEEQLSMDGERRERTS